jgi:hypothetical protein
MLHHIQKSILDSLSTSEFKRYGELKPQSMDGNIFSYHLKLLVTDRYIVKNEDGLYALSRLGKDYIIHRYEDALLQAHSIFLIVIRRGDEWLMRERLVQPLLGMSGFIHGEPIANEPLLETAARRLQEKTGLHTHLTVHSGGLIRISRGNSIESFSHAIILTGQTDQEMSVTDDATGRNHWLPTTGLQHPAILPSCSEIIDRLINNDRSPFELTYRIN